MLRRHSPNCDRLPPGPLLPHRRTEEGFAIYSESELGLGRAGGGNTPQCPFDCECCF